MEESLRTFEFKVDVNTSYMKAIRFIGAFTLGFLLASILMKYRYGAEIDWMPVISGSLCGLFLALFPGAIAKKQYLTIDDEGIHLHGYSISGGQKKAIKWDKIQSVRIDRNAISIKNKIGSIEKVKLPINTKEQISQLKAYLKRASETKNIIYGI